MFRKSIPFLFLVGFLLSCSLSAASWLAPEAAKKDPNFLWDYSMDVDSEGNALLLAVYTDLQKKSWLRSIAKPKDGSWSKPVLLATQHAYSPIVRLDREGNAVAVWRFSHEEEKTTIHAARLLFGSSEWIPIEKPLSDPTKNVSLPCLALDGEGVAFVSWSAEHNGTYFIETAKLPKNSSQWISLTPVQVPHPISNMHLAVDPAGNATMIWFKAIKGDVLSGGDEVFVSTLGSDSVLWDMPKTVEKDRYFCGARVVVDNEGNALVTWQVDVGKHLSFETYQHLIGTEEWEKVTFPEVPTYIYQGGRLTVDHAGNATFLWTPNDSKLLCCQLSQGSTAWSEPQLAIPADEGFFFWDSATDSDGNTLVVWMSDNDTLLKSSTLPAGSGTGWTAPTTITSLKHGSDPDTILYAPGSAFLLYQDNLQLKSTIGESLFNALSSSCPFFCLSLCFGPSFCRKMV